MLVAFSRSHGFVCRRIVGNQPVKLANDFKRIARSEAEGELESFGLVYVSHAAGSHLAVASAVEVLPLARGLPRVVDRIAARRHRQNIHVSKPAETDEPAYSTGNEKRQVICPSNEPGPFLAQIDHRHLAPKLDAFSNDAKPPPHLDKHDS